MILLQFIAALGIVLLLSTANVFFRDIFQLVGTLLPIGFFLSPVLYTMDMVPDAFRPLIYLNPFGLLAICYKSILFYTRVPSPMILLGAAFAAGFLILIGGSLFARFQERFPEEV